MSKFKEHYEELWYWYLTGDHRGGFSREFERDLARIRRVFGVFPGRPRCLECDRPMHGLGGRLANCRPASYSPKLCNDCEQAMRAEEGGAEVGLTLLFADVRGSTTLAEHTSTAEYKQLIQRFYQTAGEVLIRHDALVNRLMGDQVIGLFVPRFAGEAHSQAAVTAALALLRATGHADPAGPWVPVGAGIHTGSAYVGAVGASGGVNEIAVLGSAANLAARLASQAATGEVLVSEAAAAGAKLTGGERRELTLKGISEPVGVRVVKI